MSRGPSAETVDEFDYVVIGTGAAGSIVAARLAEDPGVTVCALEAGPPDHHPYIHLPAGFIKIMFNPAYTWQFKTEPSDTVNGRSVAMPIGRTVGGSSSINGMVINRGQAADFDSWAQRGNHGWGYADVLPYFKRFERRLAGGNDAYRGREGAIPVSDLDWIHPICEAFIDGAVGMGIPRNPDYNGAEQVGVGYFQRAIHKGLRRSAARMYLLPARKRTGRIDLRTNARASAILFEGRRAVGVRYVDDRNRSVSHVVKARREVIVSGGTLNTPRLLQISGVGPGALLRDLGVPVLHDLPGVGENFRDHCSVRVVARAKNSKTMNELTRGPALLGQVARWALGRPSVLALSPSLVHCFWKSEPEMSGADLQVVFTPASYKAGFVSLLDDFPGMSCGVWQHRPESTGYVRATSADPFVDPVIQPNYLKHPVDQRAMVNGIRLARRLLETPELARYVDRETLPGKDVESYDDILAWARQFGASVWHLIGTARMGPESDPTSVVDEQLRIRGLQGIRVVDASIMPSMPSANTYASTMMIAEKASDMIRGRSQIPHAAE
ncbi:GMC family oxidoreductase [Labrys monachus]|uniref:Choline dehydrogenase n=1 Tax=Labrys monachus TaxID=217067 RepID=A0ABU0FAF0_9HYPH|nr:GMC family oxidoreductase N-terminal domain-containing protein [Labrys monachus]MDQ0391307.1 choline dehydrogenase [Labrys monachus]